MNTLKNFVEIDVICHDSSLNRRRMNLTLQAVYVPQKSHLTEAQTFQGGDELSFLVDFAYACFGLPLAGESYYPFSSTIHGDPKVSEPLYTAYL